MITGDSKETAIAVAKELNIISENADNAKLCFTGNEFESLNDKQKRDILSGSSGKVFSRVEPRHKRELVKILINMVSQTKSQAVAFESQSKCRMLKLTKFLFLSIG